MATFGRVVVIVVIVLATAPGLASANVRAFIPKIYDYQGYLEVDMNHESDENTSDQRGTKNRYTVFYEKVIFSARGFIYHPRFITLHARVGGILSQEWLKTDGLPTSQSISGSDEYEIRARILPEHPYKLDLYTSRTVPLVRGQFFTSSQPVIYNSGAIFRLKRKPWFGTLAYTTNTTESQDTTSRSKTLDASLSYAKGYSDTSVGYRYSTTDSAADEGTSTDYEFDNRLRLKNANVWSNVTYEKFEEQRASSTFENRKSFLWREEANITLPWNFNAGLFYYLNKYSWPGVTTDTNNIGFSLTHHLFASLWTSYNFSFSDMSSSEGESKIISNALNTSYVKRIPWGSMRVDASVMRIHSDRSGAPPFEETHNSIDVPGSFKLTREDVDESTIEVFLKLDVPQGQPDRLPLSHDNYIITPIGNGAMFQIDIVSLPPNPDISQPPFPVPGQYNFVASYQLTSRELSLNTTSYSYGIRFELFGRSIIPYYKHSSATQEIESGTLLGGPEDTRSDLFGLQLEKGSFLLTTEYVNTRSNFLPFTSLFSELQYRNDLTPTLSVLGRARYSVIDYPEGAQGIGNAYTERTTTVSLGFSKRYPLKNLSISANGAFAQTKGITKTRSYILNSSVLWNFGTMSVRFSADASMAETDLLTGKQKRITQYYHLSVRRKLF